MIPHPTLSALSRHALISIPPDMLVSEALAVVRSHRVHHLPVTQGGTLVGLLCSCDLHAAPPHESVSTIMNTPVVMLDQNASLLAAVSTMNQHDTGSVVLMDGDHASAVLTRGDVIIARPELAALFVASERCCGHAAPSPD